MDGIVEFNLKFKKERKREIKRELERIKKILPKLNIEKAILFGSSARGDIGIESDIDLIIIKNSKIPFMDRLKTFYKNLSPRVPIDIFVYTEKEFEEIKKRDFGKSILKDGIVIYEKKRRRSKKVD